MYVVTRIICTIAKDGLVFEILEHLCKKFKTPVNATLLTTFISGLVLRSYRIFRYFLYNELFYNNKKQKS